MGRILPVNRCVFNIVRDLGNAGVFVVITCASIDHAVP